MKYDLDLGTVAFWLCVLVLGALFGGTPDIADAIITAMRCRS